MGQRYGLTKVAEFLGQSEGRHQRNYLADPLMGSEDLPKLQIKRYISALVERLS